MTIRADLGISFKKTEHLSVILIKAPKKGDTYRFEKKEGGHVPEVHVPRLHGLLPSTPDREGVKNHRADGDDTPRPFLDFSGGGI